MLHPEVSTYVIVRVDDALVLVTFAPWRALTAPVFVQNRDRFKQWLGEDHFAFTMICKELSEVTDYRSWEERITLYKKSESEENKSESKDIGYTRTKCRLCDQRMKNKISQAAVDAFQILGEHGALVQMVGRVSEGGRVVY